MINHKALHYSPELVYLVRGKDQGKPAWHYVKVKRPLINLFLKKTNGGTSNVADYGEIIKSGWGEDPDEKTVEYINEYNNDVTKYKKEENSSDMTPLHMAIFANHYNVAKILMERGADINAEDIYGLTALHYAALNEDIDMCLSLLVQGANIYKRSKDYQLARDMFESTNTDLLMILEQQIG